MKTLFNKTVRSITPSLTNHYLRSACFILILWSFTPSLFAQGLGPIPEYDPALRPDIFVYRHHGADFVFENSELKDFNLVLPTSIDFGTDGRLYIGQKNGLIIAYN